MNLLHITYDLRDRFNREKTSAVKNLIDQSKNFASVSVIDLLRVQKFSDEQTKLTDPNHLAINSFGLPYGLLFKVSQNRVVKKIYDAEKASLLNINQTELIHSHKLTFDGYVGYHLALRYNVPFIVTIRQTDTMVFKKKPGMIKIFKPIIKNCRKIIFLIPQIKLRFREIVGEEFFVEHLDNKFEFLPNIVERKVNRTLADIEEGTFLTVLRMTRESVKRKNIKRLLIAFKELSNKRIKLKIIGDGEFMNTIKKWVNKFNLNEKIIFIGNVKNDMMDDHYAKAEAFLLPSKSESFGMVYAEALMNGTPIMYSKGCLGVDGVFEGVGVGVDPLSVESIVNGIKDLLSNKNNYRRRISELVDNNEFKIFSADHIENKYRQIVTNILEHERN